MSVTEEVTLSIVCDLCGQSWRTSDVNRHRMYVLDASFVPDVVDGRKCNSGSEDYKALDLCDDCLLDIRYVLCRCAERLKLTSASGDKTGPYR
jgi:hypothetical protein